jgi:hypothetical protein
MRTEPVNRPSLGMANQDADDSAAFINIDHEDLVKDKEEA